MAGVGLAILGSITASSPNGLALVVIASTIISIGLGPIFGLTTELIVGSAPPERAGAATGMSETGSEVGGALGLSLLGTIGLAIYRSQMTTDLPAGVPDGAAAAARDTLGAALEVASELPAAVGDAVARLAQDAFVDGMQVAAFISVALSILVAVVSFVGLRHVPPTDTEPLGTEQPREDAEDVSTPRNAPIARAPESGA